LELHKEIEKDYTVKYNKYKLKADDPENLGEAKKLLTKRKEETIVSEDGAPEVNNTSERTDMYEELKEYRLNKSRDEKIKPYFIYSNKELEEMVLKKPINKEELKLIRGFGEVKIAKYGDDIVEIIGRYT